MRGERSDYTDNDTEPDRSVHLRADAERNRDRILLAAREAFAERGLGVGTEEIARRAGVGKGTVYRRFPTKRALVDAVLEDLVGSFEGLADEAESRPDALDGLREYLVRAALLHLEHAAFFEAAIVQDGGAGLSPELRERILDACARPLRRAQAAGIVRAQLGPMDVVQMAKMLAVASAGPGESSPDDLDRYVALLLDGARPR